MKFAITVQGNEKKWNFIFEADEKFHQDWIDDGLDVCKLVEEIKLSDKEFRNIRRMLKSRKNGMWLN